jgi:hypothetical protein
LYQDAFRKPILRGLGCPDGVWVGSSVSEVLAAFVASLAGRVRETHDDRAVWLDRCCPRAAYRLLICGDDTKRAQSRGVHVRHSDIKSLALRSVSLF